jgi:integrase
MTPVPFSDFMDEVLRLYRPPMRRPATYHKTRQVLGEFRKLCATTADLTPLAVADWLADGPVRAAATSESLLRHLQAACAYGVTKSYLVSPFDFRSISQWLPADELEEAEDFRAHRSADEIRQVLAQADLEAQGGSWEALRLRAAIYSWAYTGAGKLEVLGLRHRDVDLGTRVITIRTHPRRRLKTGPRAARLPIAWPLAEVLAGWLPHAPGEWIFPHKRFSGPWFWGRPGHKPLDQVKALGRRAGVDKLTILAFRHTVGTLSEDWGIGELMLQRILRHSTRKTQRHYRHEDVELLHRAAERIHY